MSTFAKKNTVRKQVYENVHEYKNLRIYIYILHTLNFISDSLSSPFTRMCYPRQTRPVHMHYQNIHVYECIIIFGTWSYCVMLTKNMQRVAVFVRCTSLVALRHFKCGHRHIFNVFTCITGVREYPLLTDGAKITTAVWF